MSHVSLFIHDSFLDAFAKLPKAIQKKTREFMQKFKENPTSSAINYEKISTFADQSLRTVRIDQKYRAIVQAPQIGNDYHLLWVDNHDEAMKWATRKIFSWNENTQSFQHYDMPDQDISIATTPEAIKLFVGLSDHDFLQIGTPEHMIVLLKEVATLQDLEKLEPHLPVDNYEYLYFLAEGIPLEEILEEIAEGKSGDLSANMQRHVFILTEDKDIEEILSGNFEKWKLFLHPSQRKIAYGDFNGPVKITGGAGTGKTVCAMHRVKYLLSQSEVFAKPILFTTYTKSLTAYLKDTIKGFELPENAIEITNIDKLMLDIASNPKYRIIPATFGYITYEQEEVLWREVLEQYPSTKDEAFMRDEYNEVIIQNNVVTLDDYLRAPRIGRTTRIGRKEKCEFWELVQKYKQHKGSNYSGLELCSMIIRFFTAQTVDKPYAHIICDEMQDFNNMQLTVLRMLTDEQKNDLFLVGDPYQNIYGKQLNFTRCGINVRGKRSRKLRINYRTTEEIKLQALKVIKGLEFDDFNGEEENNKGYLSLIHGEAPIYQIFDKPEQQDEYLINAINSLIKQDISLGDICISSRTNAGVDETKSLLNKQEIPYIDISKAGSNHNAIRVSSLHNMKGYEFKFVFITGVSKETVPYIYYKFHLLTDKEKEVYYKQERSLYYVAFSRAIQRLFLSGVGEKSDWF